MTCVGAVCYVALRQARRVHRGDFWCGLTVVTSAGGPVGAAVTRLGNAALTRLTPSLSLSILPRQSPPPRISPSLRAGHTCSRFRQVWPPSHLLARPRWWSNDVNILISRRGPASCPHILPAPRPPPLSLVLPLASPRPPPALYMTTVTRLKEKYDC